MTIVGFDSVRVRGLDVDLSSVGVVYGPRSAPRPRLSGVFTASASMACTLPEWEVFSAALRDAAPKAAPLFDLLVCYRERLAPALVVRLEPRGRRCRSYLRERFKRTTDTLRGCSLEVSP